MDRLHRAIKDVHRLDDLAARDTALTRLPPLAKLLSVLVYLICTLSFGKYALTGLLGMALYPVLLYEIDDLPLGATLWRGRGVALLLAAVGVWNVFFDRTPALALGPVVLSGGALSLATLIIKGMLSFLAVYLLIATTGMEQVCAALRQLHVPRVMVTTILLTYRYIVLLLQEGNRISTAYALRAPGQKGIAFKAWGSLLGLLLLRSIERAQLVYESMMLRGYGYRDAAESVGASIARPRGLTQQPVPRFVSHTANGQRAGIARPYGVVFVVTTILFCLIFRFIPVFDLLGGVLWTQF